MICFSFLFGFIQLGSFRLFVSFWFYSAWELSFVRIPCCDCIVAHPADRQHIVPSYLKITQNDKFSVKVEPFTGNPLCHPL